MILMNKIIIGKPKVEECKSEVFGKAVRLVADVTMNNPNTNKLEKKECYFEFEKECEKYICDERSDAFVMGLLTTAMENNMDIEFEAPISEKVYYQLSTYYIPMISKYNADYPMHNIKLIGPLDNSPIKNEKAVATGCSGGVDSFYTIAKHLSKDVPNSNKITHLIYNSSASADILKERLIKSHAKNIEIVKSIAKDCGIKCIACYNNLYEFYKYPLESFTMFFTIIFSAVPFALQKIIKTYYASSGEPIDKFSISLKKEKGRDASLFDIFTLECINSENLNFYSTGMEINRIEKEQYISEFHPAQEKLTVCADTPYIEKNIKFTNCSICPKCLRTMVQFYAIGKLDNFKKVFDVENFYKHKAKYIGKMMGSSKVNYVKETKLMASKNKIKIPFPSYLYCYLWYKPFNIMKKMFKKSLFIRKIYYKFNLDYKINGYRHPSYETYAEKFKKAKKSSD